MQETPQNKEKPNKKYIDISFGKIITAIIIIALLIGDIWLGIYAYNIRNRENNINNNSIENTINE